MDIADIVKSVLGVIGVVVAFPLTRSVIALSRDWGQRGELMKETARGVDTIGAKFDQFAQTVSQSHDEIFSRLDRQEFILTGDKGVNGVRGEVKDIRESLAKKAQEEHNRIGEWGMWRFRTDDRLTGLEQRAGFPKEKREVMTRRKSPPRKPAGRRKADG